MHQVQVCLHILHVLSGLTGDTDDTREGPQLIQYYTDARADARIGAANLS